MTSLSVRICLLMVLVCLTSIGTFAQNVTYLDDDHKPATVEHYAYKRVIRYRQPYGDVGPGFHICTLTDYYNTGEIALTGDVVSTDTNCSRRAGFDGVVVTYFKTGGIKLKMPWKAGKLNGVAIFFNEAGNEEKRQVYSKGKVLDERGPGFKDVFCKIAKSLGKNCDATLELPDLADGIYDYLKSSGFECENKPDYVDFDIMELINSWLGDGAAHIEEEVRPNRYLDRSLDPSGRSIILPPPVRVRWWALDDPRDRTQYIKLVADNVDQPFARLRGYANILAAGIDAFTHGTNAKKLNDYFVKYHKY